MIKVAYFLSDLLPIGLIIWGQYSSQKRFSTKRMKLSAETKTQESFADLIFVTNLTNQVGGEKICHMEKFQVSLHMEKFQMSPHDICGKI